MDPKLVAWARSVKRRDGRMALPPLWLVSDAARMPDLCAVVAALPPRLCGVIFRHDPPGHDPVARAWLATEVARICRRRHLALSIAGDWRLASRLRAGLHTRGGWRQAGSAPRFVTSSAHGEIEYRRALRTGARLILLSPIFPTRSHPGRSSLGPARWAHIARDHRRRAAALGGVNGDTVRQLPRWCGHVGAIEGLLARAVVGTGPREVIGTAESEG